MWHCNFYTFNEMKNFFSKDVNKIAQDKVENLNRL